MKEKLSPRMDFTAQPKPATALCGVVSADGKIAYPPGVKEITDKITTDEMIKRLKVSFSGQNVHTSDVCGRRCSVLGYYCSAGSGLKFHLPGFCFVLFLRYFTSFFLRPLKGIVLSWLYL